MNDIDLLVVTMGEDWALEILRHNINNAGVARGHLCVSVFANGKVGREWRDLADNVLSDGLNHGFPAAANELLHFTSAPTVVLMDDDVRHQEGWLWELERARAAVEASHIYAGKVGVGAVPLDEWKDETNGLGPLVVLDGVGIRPRGCPIGGTRHFRRSLLAKVGYISELYYPCGGDDVDFLQRVHFWGGHFNYHIEAVRSKHEHHDRGAKYAEAKQKMLNMIGKADEEMRKQYQAGNLRYEPGRPWIFS